MKRTSRVAATLALLAVTVGSVQAQVINYTTTGRFTSPTATCNAVAFSTSATCAGAGWNLLYNGVAGTNLGNGTITSLGTFLLTGSGNASVAPGVIRFELMINQTTPSVGSGVTSGSVFGTVMTGAGGNVSTIEWDPNQFVTIGSTSYQLIFDNVGPATDRGLGIPINNERGISAIVRTAAVVPEPSSYLLMGTGLSLLVMMVRRRTNT